ncbi:MAG: hypothetical protein ACRD45_08810 [Bryobacteraceae bacterium]
MRLSALVLVSLVAFPVFGQQQQNTQENNQGFYNPFTLASGILQHNFFNVFAYGNGAYDTNSQILANGKTTGSFGYALGGGIQLSHVWKTATLGLSYSGAYQHYNSSFFASGPTQNLVLGYTKQFSKRWALSLSEAAGIYLYGESYYSTQATNTNPVVTNPFSSQTRFASSSISLTYRQTRRLSYVFSGFYSLYRYNGPRGIGANDVGASIGADYQLTGRTTVGGRYSYSYFRYQRHAGSDHLNGIYGTITHAFSRRWTASASVGLVRSNASGIITVPITIITGTGQTLSGYEVGAYHNSQFIPSLTGTISHLYRRSQFSISGGQGVSSGNGVFLASRNRYIGGVYSYNLRNSVFSVGASYNRLSSISNTINYGYSSENLTASYGHNLFRYVAANLRYDFIEYGGLGAFGARHDNHFTFGLSFSSKSIPLTLY